MADRYDEEMFLGYVEGELSPQQAAQFEELMREDARLRNLVAQIISDRNNLRSLPPVDPPTAFNERPTEHLERGMLLGPAETRPAVRPRPNRMRFARLVAYSGLAAMLLLCVSVVIQTLTDQNIGQLGHPTDPGTVAIAPPPEIDETQPPYDTITTQPPTMASRRTDEPDESDQPSAATLAADAGSDRTGDSIDDPAPTHQRDSEASTSDAMVAMQVPESDDGAGILATEPLVVLPQPAYPMVVDETQPLMVRPRHESEPYIWRFGPQQPTASARVVDRHWPAEVKLTVRTRDLRATAEEIRAWAIVNGALIVNPTADLLALTGVVIPPDTTMEGVITFTPEDLEAHDILADPTQLIGAEGFHVMLLAVAPEKIERLQRHLDGRGGVLAVARGPNPAIVGFTPAPQEPNDQAAPNDDTPGVESEEQAQDLDAGSQGDAAPAQGMDESPLSLEALVDGMLTEPSDEPTEIAANQAVQVSTPAKPTPTVPPRRPAHEPVLLAVEIHLLRDAR